MLFFKGDRKYDVSPHVCRYCKKRCLLWLPDDCPMWVWRKYWRAYEGLMVMATCKGGQAADRENTGYSFDYLASYYDHQSANFMAT